MDIEQSAIGHLVEQSGITKLWNEGIRVQHFEDPVLRSVFDFSVDYWIQSGMRVAPTPEILEHEFPSYQYTHPEETAIWISGELKKRYITNQLQDTIRDSAQLSVDGDPHGALKEMFEGSWETMRKTAKRTNRSDMSKNLDQRRARYADRATFTGDVRGAPLGLKEVDEHTNGLLPGELAAFAGFAKSGKSHLICKTAVSLRKAGYTPYVATLELSVEDMEDRIDAHMSGVAYERIQKGRLGRKEVDQLLAAQEEYAKLGPIFVEKLPVGERTVQHIVSSARQNGATALLIDQLSFMEPASSTYRRETKDIISEIVFSLKAAISEDEESMLPCFLAVQFNRASRSEKGKRGSMEHIALSSSIEQTVDIAYGLYQPEEMRVNNSMILDIIGNRRGAPGSWLLEWQLGEATRVEVRQVYEE